MSKNVAVLIGRFQPFHLGHQHIVDQAVKSGKYQHLIFLLGSAEQARTPKNPFTFQERKQMIENSLESLLATSQVQVSILPLHDFVYDNNKWIAETQNLIHSVTKADDKITLIGNVKDKSSYYLKFFPQFESDFSSGIVLDNLSATDIRSTYFSNYETIKKLGNSKNYVKAINDHLSKLFKGKLNAQVVEYLTAFAITHTEELTNLFNEYTYIQNYRKQMLDSLPFKNIAFFTGDALVTCAGHLLLIKRKIAPGKGLYALPGGFFDGNTDLNTVETGIRELYEETKIGISKQYAKSHIVKSIEFGDFDRSERWRIITNATFIKLPDTTLPKVKGSDDAAEAIWMPFVEIVKNRDKFFEDHLSIIDTFLNIL